MGLPRSEVCFASGMAEFHELVVLGIPNVLTDDVVSVNPAIGNLVELIQGRYLHRCARSSVTRGDVHFYLCADDAFAAGYRSDKSDIRFVVTAFYTGSSDLDL